MSIGLEAPLAFGTGHTTTLGLLLTNLSDRDIGVHTNGHLTATIVDDTGAAIGGYVGARSFHW